MVVVVAGPTGRVSSVTKPVWVGIDEVTVAVTRDVGRRVTNVAHRVGVAVKLPVDVVVAVEVQLVGRRVTVVVGAVVAVTQARSGLAAVFVAVLVDVLVPADRAGVDGVQGAVTVYVLVAVPLGEGGNRGTVVRVVGQGPDQGRRVADLRVAVVVRACRSGITGAVPPIAQIAACRLALGVGRQVAIGAHRVAATLEAAGRHVAVVVGCGGDEGVIGEAPHRRRSPVVHPTGDARVGRVGAASPVAGLGVGHAHAVLVHPGLERRAGQHGAE